jgi:NTE family protein
LDVTGADLIVGTSAGSTAAAQITSASPAELLAAVLDAAPPQRTGSPGPGSGPVSARPLANQLETTSAIIAASDDAADMRRRLGAWALEVAAASDRSRAEHWRATVAARLPSQDWPTQRVLITAVDADTGQPVVFDRHSGVDLADAVAASTSSGIAYPIGECHYIDGGYRSNADNADLAAGHSRVLVLSPFGGRSRTPVAWGTHLATHVDDLRARGSRVETVFPDDRSLTAFGANMMDASTRPPAARAGHDQGLAVAAQLLDLWR